MYYIFSKWVFVNANYKELFAKPPEKPFPEKPLSIQEVLQKWVKCP